jgi:hypothetical protein
VLSATCLGVLLGAPAAALAETRAEATGGVTIKPAKAPARHSEAAPVAPKGVIAAGLATPPAGAPPQVVAAIAAANRIVGKPYRYGGGHRAFEDAGYDCSGSVSYALGGAGLLRTPLDSRSFASWAAPGRGQWITVYTNPSHAYVVIAGLRLDTSGSQRMVLRYGGQPGTGPRWRGRRSSLGYVARHPVGL